MAKRYGKSQQACYESSCSPVSFSTPIVGRQRELTLIMSHYEAAKEGHAHVVMLTGEPGMGKTRLLEEVAQQTMQDGAIVLRGNASEAEGMPPFLPFLEALGRYIRMAPQDQLCVQVAAVPQVLASLLPELTLYLHDLQASLPGPPEQMRLRLYEAIGIFLETISATHTLVLALDDLHWADSVSLDLLCYLSHHWSNTRLLILGSYREGEIDQNAALAHALAEISHQRILTSVAIGPLSVEEIGMLVTRRHGGSLSPEVNALLYTQSEGNPFFAEEIFEGWIESGALKLEHQQWVTITSLTHTLPPTIVGALRQRFARLDPVIVNHLRVAAIIGRSFDLSLLATVEEQEIEAIEECLLAAIRARLVRTVSQGHFLFSHDKIRECLYIEVSSSRRQRLHELIGHELEVRYEQEHTISVYQLANLAFHFTHSSDRVRGIHYSLLASRQAMQTAAYEEAMLYYRTTLELFAPEDSRRGSILLEMGQATLLAGKEQEAEILYAAAQCSLLQTKERVALITRATHGLGLALWRQEKWQEACAALEHALALFGDDQCTKDDQCTEKVQILIDLSHLLMTYMGQQAKAVALASQALEMAHNLGEVALEMIARRIIVGTLLLQSIDLSPAVQVLEEALEHTQEHGDPAEVGECCLNLAVAYYWMARVRRSYEISLQRIALVERCQQSYQSRTAYTWPILLLASQGKWEQAEQEVARALPVVEAVASPMPYAFLRQLQGFLAYQQEKYAVAERELEAAQELVGQNLQSGLGDMTFYLGLLGLLQATLEKREEASASITRLEHILELLPNGILPTAPMKICLALTYIVQGDYEQAKSFYTPLLSFHGQLYWFLVDRVLGLLAILKGEWETAAVHLAEAEMIARKEGLQPELARTLQGQANLALGKGGQDAIPDAVRLLKKALALFEDLGMTDSAHHVRHKLQSLSHQTQEPACPSSLPAHLTQREAEVLKLVTCGKSNSQIAQELVISEKTVINHLTHIFTKTNSGNRVAAAAFAIRHGLA